MHFTGNRITIGESHVFQFEDQPNLAEPKESGFPEYPRQLLREEQEQDGYSRQYYSGPIDESPYAVINTGRYLTVNGSMSKENSLPENQRNENPSPIFGIPNIRDKLS
jgi:hypothetical protein